MSEPAHELNGILEQVSRRMSEICDRFGGEVWQIDDSWWEAMIKLLGDAITSGEMDDPAERENAQMRLKLLKAARAYRNVVSEVMTDDLMSGLTTSLDKGE